MSKKTNVYKLFLILLAIMPFFRLDAQVKKEILKQPNILFLLADDLGYGELGCYGQKVIQTPVLDKMAKDGIRLTNFYAGNAVCSPSRAVLMTGVNSSNNTIRGNNGLYGERFDRVPLKPTDETLAEMLRKVGYQTAFIGKWHLDDPNDLNTWAYSRGFDYAVQEQWGSHFTGQGTRTEHWEYINGIEDSVRFKVNQWNCQDEFRTKLAIDYLDKREKDKPFFLFMSYRAPHAHEYELGNKTLYADRGWPEVERRHAAKVTLLDTQIGRMLKKLEEIGELENTLIFFTSDNGPHGEEGHDYEFFNSNSDLRGFKRDTYEGGIRVPAIIYWKGKIKGGQVSDYIGCGQDFMPTIAEVVRTAVPAKSNGVSFFPLIKGKTPEKREFLNWEFQKNGFNPENFRQAVRIGNMKAVRYGIDSPTEIYDLNTDISETHDISNQYPDLVKKVNCIFREQRSKNLHYPYGGYKNKQ